MNRTTRPMLLLLIIAVASSIALIGSTALHAQDEPRTTAGEMVYLPLLRGGETLTDEEFSVRTKAILQETFGQDQTVIDAAMAELGWQPLEVEPTSQDEVPSLTSDPLTCGTLDYFGAYYTAPPAPRPGKLIFYASFYAKDRGTGRFLPCDIWPGPLDPFALIITDRQERSLNSLSTNAYMYGRDIFGHSIYNEEIAYVNQLKGSGAVLSFNDGRATFGTAYVELDPAPTRRKPYYVTACWDHNWSESSGTDFGIDNISLSFPPLAVSASFTGKDKSKVRKWSSGSKCERRLLKGL